MKKIQAHPSKAPFKTLMEYVPSEENLKLAIRAIARRERVITADNLHVLDHSMRLLGKDTRAYGAYLRELADEGFLKKGSIVYSERETCHGRYLCQWHSMEAKR